MENSGHVQVVLGVADVVVEGADQHEGDLEEAIGLLEKHGTLKDTVERARHYGAIARDALGIFPETEAKAALIEAIDFSIERAY